MKNLALINEMYNSSEEAEHPDSVLNVQGKEHEYVQLSERLNWLPEHVTKLVRGGIYLVAGQPGIGKSTLGIQLVLDLARQGERALYLLTEESKSQMSNRVRQMVSCDSVEDANGSLGRFLADDSMYDIEVLPQFLSREILSPRGRYHGIRFLVLDSIQGQGLSSTASKKYRALYEFCRQCKSEGITVVLVAHVTKRGEIAGPKDLEHNVDCVMVMRKAMSYRPLFVPKNRFGPAVLEPVPLVMDKKTTELRLAPHRESVSTVAKSFLGQHQGTPEVQAAVSLPSYGTRGRITSLGLPKKEIEQLTSCISQLPGLELDNLDYTIQCRLPGEKRYRSMLGLPLAMSLIGSYVQRSIPEDNLYIGEIDLGRRVRALPEFLVDELLSAIENGKIRRPVRIFVAKESAELVRARPLEGAFVAPCEQLDDAVHLTWPDLAH